MTQRSSRSALFLMELIFSILFFALASAVCFLVCFFLVAMIGAVVWVAGKDSNSGLFSKSASHFRGTRTALYSRPELAR